MAITYFGAASSPADNGTKAGDTATSVTPPGSMVSGDLVVLYSQYRTSSGGDHHSITTTGGQSWNTLAEQNGGTQEVRVFWCQYNGTWAADPAVTRAGGTSVVAHTVVMLVYRPTAGSYTFAVDQAQAFAAPATATTVTITGQTPSNASSVGIAGWFSQDDNTWGNLAGSGWAVAGGAQYRNTTGSDISCSFADCIKTSAATQADVSKDQLTLGADATITHIITFYEDSGATLESTTQFLTMMGCGT